MFSLTISVSTSNGVQVTVSRETKPGSKDYSDQEILDFWSWQNGESHACS